MLNAIEVGRQFGRQMIFCFIKIMEDFFRLVVDNFRFSPEKINHIVFELVCQIRGAQCFQVIRIGLLTNEVFQVLTGYTGFGGSRRFAFQHRCRIGQLTVPIAVKGSRNFPNRRTDNHHIQIGKGQFRIGLEIFIADIASSQDGGLVIDRKGLVVHAAGYGTQAGHKLKGPSGLATEGVENANLHVGVAI